MLFNKQRTGKSETTFKAKQPSKRLPGSNFNKHAKFTLIEQLLHDPSIENELLTTD